MGFRPPVFNLTANVWRAASDPDVDPPDVVTECQLRAAGKQSTGQDAAHDWVFLWAVLVPKDTDIRDWASGSRDYIEIPAASGRMYRIEMVDDVGKGFTNEYRTGFIQKETGWPAPIP